MRRNNEHVVPSGHVQSPVWTGLKSESPWPREQESLDHELMQLVDQELEAFEHHLGHSLGKLDGCMSTMTMTSHPSTPPVDRLTDPCIKPLSTLPKPCFQAKTKLNTKRPTVGKRQRVDGSSGFHPPQNGQLYDSLWSAQASNLQLKQVLHDQMTQAQEMLQLVTRQVNRDLAFWFCHENRMKEIRNTALDKKKPRHGFFHRPTAQQEEDDYASRRLVEEAHVYMMLQRVDYSFQQIDLVFQQHLATTWQADNLGAQPFSQVRLRRALPKGFPASTSTWSSNDGKFVNQHNDFAELVGCAVTQFDANTLLELIWKCFASRDKERCSTCGTTSSQKTAWGDLPGCKKEHNDFSYHEVHSTVTDTVPPTVCEEFRNTVTGNVIRVNGHFEILLPQETYLEVDVNGALKKFSNAIVIDSIGKAAVSPGVGLTRRPQQQQHIHVDFTRSAWLRVESLEDGRSMLRHVYRMWPVTTSLHPAARETVQDVHKLHQEQLELMGQMLQRAHSEMSNRFERLVKQQLVEGNAVWTNDNGQGHQWWLHDFRL